MKLIINADDFGKSRSVNEAILKLTKLGSVTSTSVMVNMPFAREVSKLRNNPKIGAGLHFNLTEGLPISNPETIPSLVDGQGRFFSYPLLTKKLWLQKISRDHIQRELHAQREAFNDYFGENPGHFDSHQNIHKHFAVARALIDYGRKNPGFGIRSPQRYYLQMKNSNWIIKSHLFKSQLKKGIKTSVSAWYFKWLAYKFLRVFKAPAGELHFETLKKLDFFNWMVKADPIPATDKVFEVPCHPAISTLGIENSKLTGKRVEEFELLSSAVFLKALNKFQLTSFKDL